MALIADTTYRDTFALQLNDTSILKNNGHQSTSWRMRFKSTTDRTVEFWTGSSVGHRWAKASYYPEDRKIVLTIKNGGMGGASTNIYTSRP